MKVFGLLIFGIISAAMIGAINECFNTDDPNGRLCFAYPDSKFKQEWGDCIFGELTPEEEILSDRIVRAWTNFAIHGFVQIRHMATDSSTNFQTYI